VRSDGKTGGYNRGAEKKKALLEKEAKIKHTG
jgi:O6-methylguanine-DNA--protein-cysteine methyltransferase